MSDFVNLIFAPSRSNVLSGVVCNTVLVVISLDFCPVEPITVNYSDNGLVACVLNSYIAALKFFPCSVKTGSAVAVLYRSVKLMCIVAYDKA